LKADQQPYGIVAKLYEASAQRVVRLDDDGGFRVLSIAARRPLIRGRFIDDEIVMFNDQGYYAGTEEAAKFAYLSFPGVTNAASLDQFKAVLNNPQVVRNLLSGEVATFPDLALVPPPSASIQIDFGSLGPTGHPLKAKISATSETQLGEIRIFIDGARIMTMPVSGTSATSSIDLPQNRTYYSITAQAIDMNLSASQPATLTLPNRTAKTSLPRLHLIAVGTNSYREPIGLLVGAENDARLFAAAAQSSPLYDHSAPPVVLAGSNDLKLQLIEAIRSVAQTAQSSETLMLSIAGHGMLGPDGHLYLLDSNSDPTAIASTATRWDDIASELRRVKARTIVFLDVCHAGASGQQSVADIAVASLEAAGGPMVIISASKGRQLSREGPRAGIFTGTVHNLVTRQRRAVNRNRDGFIDLRELYSSLKLKVSTATNGEQTPWISRNDMVGTTPIF
jgi:hypothetical protein